MHRTIINKLVMNDQYIFKEFFDHIKAQFN